MYDVKHQRCQRRAAIVPTSVLLMLTITIAGCSEPTVPELPVAMYEAVVEYDPFGADMGVWSCNRYVAAMRNTPHELTLNRILSIRPHRYWQPESIERLVTLDADLVTEHRKNWPVYHHLIHPEVAETLGAMIAAANAEGLKLRVQSAFRSPGYQNYLWKLQVRRYESDLSRAAFVVAPPCYSEHATGRAIDFYTGGERFENSAEYRWLQANAVKWGWVQSFRDDNGATRSPESTGIMVEPWHFHHLSLRAGIPGSP